VSFERARQAEHRAALVGAVASYQRPDGTTVLVDVLDATHRAVAVRVWGETRRRWVHQRYLSPHLTPREQGLVDARRRLLTPTGGVHP
jgi:hypothetical protein